MSQEGLAPARRAEIREGAASRSELDRRRALAAGRRLEVRSSPEAPEGGHDARGEALDGRVVGAHDLVVAAPFDGDPVLRPLELALERQEVLVRLEVRVALDHREEPAEGAAQL